MVIDETADIDLAVKLACEGAYKNSGQRCSSLKRLIVLPKVKQEFIDSLMPRVESLITADPSDPNTDIGTVVDEQSAVIVENRIEDAVKQGAKLLTGGIRTGAQITPAVVSETNMEMDLVKEETFGPVMPIIDCEDFQHAIQIVNDTKFGLNAALVSDCHSNINTFIKSVIVGGIRINAASSFRNEMMPFGGINHSGYGRGGIIYAMKEMTNLKTVLI